MRLSLGWPFRRRRASPAIGREADAAPTPGRVSEDPATEGVEPETGMAGAVLDRARDREGVPILGPQGGLPATARFLATATEQAETLTAATWSREVFEATQPPAGAASGDFAASLPSLASYGDPAAMVAGDLEGSPFGDRLPATSGETDVLAPTGRAAGGRTATGGRQPSPASRPAIAARLADRAPAEPLRGAGPRAPGLVERDGVWSQAEPGPTPQPGVAARPPQPASPPATAAKDAETDAQGEGPPPAAGPTLQREPGPLAAPAMETPARPPTGAPPPISEAALGAAAGLPTGLPVVEAATAPPPAYDVPLDLPLAQAEVEHPREDPGRLATPAVLAAQPPPGSPPVDAPRPGPSIARTTDDAGPEQEVARIADAPPPSRPGPSIAQDALASAAAGELLRTVDLGATAAAETGLTGPEMPLVVPALPLPREPLPHEPPPPLTALLTPAEMGITWAPPAPAEARAPSRTGQPAPSMDLAPPSAGAGEATPHQTQAVVSRKAEPGPSPAPAPGASHVSPASQAGEAATSQPQSSPAAAAADGGRGVPPPVLPPVQTFAEFTPPRFSTLDLPPEDFATSLFDEGYPALSLIERWFAPSLEGEQGEQGETGGGMFEPAHGAAALELAGPGRAPEAQPPLAAASPGAPAPPAIRSLETAASPAAGAGTASHPRPRPPALTPLILPDPSTLGSQPSIGRTYEAGGAASPSILAPFRPLSQPMRLTGMVEEESTALAGAPGEALTGELPPVARMIDVPGGGPGPASPAELVLSGAGVESGGGYGPVARVFSAGQPASPTGASPQGLAGWAFAPGIPPATPAYAQAAAEMPLGPTPSMVAQREGDDAALAGSPATATVTSVLRATDAAPSPGGSPGGGGATAEADVDKLTERVWQLIRRRLQVERERQRGLP